jgi:hypothetical protein
MGDRFRSMIESELAEVEPPPIGDLVDNAIRDGRTLRRTRLVQRGVACVAAVGALVLGAGLTSTTLRTDKPSGPGYGVAADVPSWPDGTGPTGPGSTGPTGPATAAKRATAMPADTPTMGIYQANRDYAGFQSRPPEAAPASVLLALGSVLPAGATTGEAGGRFDTFTGVQLFLNRGEGLGMVRVAVARYLMKPPPCASSPGVVVRCTEADGAVVETFEIESNCVQRRGVNVYRDDGVVVQVNVGSCLVEGRWTTPPDEPVVDQVLAVSEAVKIGLAPVWNEKMMIESSAKAGQRYPDLPILTAFDGVGA